MNNNYNLNHSRCAAAAVQSFQQASCLGVVRSGFQVHEFGYTAGGSGNAEIALWAREGAKAGLASGYRCGEQEADSHRPGKEIRLPSTGEVGCCLGSTVQQSGRAGDRNSASGKEKGLKGFEFLWIRMIKGICCVSCITCITDRGM